MSLLSLASAAPEAAPVAVTNLTPTFYATCVAIVGLFGILVRQWVLLKKVQADSDASLRADLMSMLAQEKEQHADAMAAIRHEHAAEFAALRQELHEERRRCDEEMAKQRAQVEGLQRMIVRWQITSGRAIEFGHGHSPEAAK